MQTTSFTDDAKVMAKGQITIPKNVRTALGVETGDRVTFIVDETGIRVVNSAVYALLRFQEQMSGKAPKAGFFTEEDVSEWISSSRKNKKSTN